VPPRAALGQSPVGTEKGGTFQHRNRVFLPEGLAVENRDPIASECPLREDEFIELLASHKHQIFNFIFCILHSLSDAEEVFQQTSIALWENFDQFETNSDFGAWAAKVARFRTLNFLRAKRRERLYFSDNIIAQLAECPFESNDMQDSRLRALSECRQKLSSSDQALVAMCYRGDAIRDVAVKIGRPIQAVYKSLARIRRMLFECIERTLAREGHS
jgi:RNA polymerase sigma-70 factor (ECF subfamily)